MPHICLKAGVSLDKLTPQAVFAMVVCADVLEDYARTPLTITSVGPELTEKQSGKLIHKADSLHYKGRAFDFRTRTMTDTQRTDVIDEIKSRLGSEFDVVLEGDHGHVEWDPDWDKAPRTT